LDSRGGYGLLGAKGAATILDGIALQKYTHIIAAIGSGTMVAGILNGSLSHQTIVGISSQKNNLSLEEEIYSLTEIKYHHRLTINHQYHFGGFAKHPSDLIHFMTDFWKSESIPTDIVYYRANYFLQFYRVTGKKTDFKPADKLLVIHSGGLQGNFSLTEKSLPF
jgi:1-aminocyclopropane-1-carboxylate deaminase